MSRRLTGRKGFEEDEGTLVRKSRRRGVVTMESREHFTGDAVIDQARKQMGKATEIEMKEAKEKRFGL